MSMLKVLFIPLRSHSSTKLIVTVNMITADDPPDGTPRTPPIQYNGCLSFGQCFAVSFHLNYLVPYYGSCCI